MWSIWRFLERSEMAYNRDFNCSLLIFLCHRRWYYVFSSFISMLYIIFIKGWNLQYVLLLGLCWWVARQLRGFRLTLQRIFLHARLTPSWYSRRLRLCLHGVPWVRNKLQYFIKIDVTGLNIVQNIPHNFLLPGNNSLNLQNRIIDSGITIFKIKF